LYCTYKCDNKAAGNLSRTALFVQKHGSVRRGLSDVLAADNVFVTITFVTTSRTATLELMRMKRSVVSRWIIISCV